LDQRCASEVTDERLTLRIKEEIGWLEVVVKQPQVVRPRDAMAGLPNPPNHIIHVEPTWACRGECLVECPMSGEFGHEVGAT
jgi:hypothetical protein